MAGGLSRTGKCGPCGEAAYREAMHSIVTRHGKAYQKYRDGLTDYVARLWGENEIPDTLPADFEQLSILEAIQ